MSASARKTDGTSRWNSNCARCYLPAARAQRPAFKAASISESANVRLLQGNVASSNSPIRHRKPVRREVYEQSAELDQLLNQPPPTSRKGPKLQRSVSREFAPTNLREEDDEEADTQQLGKTKSSWCSNSSGLSVSRYVSPGKEELSLRRLSRGQLIGGLTPVMDGTYPITGRPHYAIRTNGVHRPQLLGRQTSPHQRALAEGGSSWRRLDVDVTCGTVTLQGTVSSFDERQLCLACAEHVPGVLRVVDELKVEVPVRAVRTT